MMTNAQNSPDGFSLPQAAKLSGYTEQRLYQRLKGGTLPARKVRTFEWRVSAAVVEMLKAERQAYAERRARQLAQAAAA